MIAVFWWISSVTAMCAEKPNIVLIMADDMGYSDLGCYGSEIPTPNLDRLGYEGIRFTRFYNTGRCCPTRASLLTGLHPHQTGIGHMVSDQKLPGYRGDLNEHCVTIAQVLRESGYRNYCTGKWHVCRNTRSDGPKHNWPLQRGFDRFYGCYAGTGNYFEPIVARDNTPISPFDDPEYKPDEYYFTDAVSDQAARFIREHQRQTPDKPFFLYVAYTAPHWPMQAPEKAIEKHKGKYDAGYEPIRRARYERMKKLGIVKDSWPLSPQHRPWSEVKNVEWERRCMEVYAAMIGVMDEGVGRIVDSLKETGRFKNTVILFLQDNGGCAEKMGRAPRNDHPKRVDKPVFELISNETVLEDRKLVDTRTRAGFPRYQGPQVMPGPTDTHIAYGPGWANVSNTPFREYKHWVHEGGIATPLIVHAPKHVAASMKGKLCDQPGQLVDVMTTLVELADAEYPKRFDGKEILPMEGVSLLPCFKNEKINRDKPLVWEHEGNRAIRDGKWKLVAKGSKGKWELYDLEADRSEMNDLSQQYPDRVEAMAKQWNDWAVRAKVLPWPWNK